MTTTQLVARGSHGVLF